MDSRISEHQGVWSVGSRRFDSAQAAEHYLIGRDKTGPLSMWRWFVGAPWYSKLAVVMFGLIVLNVIGSFSQPGRAPSAPDATAMAPVAREISYDAAERVATLINLNGQLCARVTEVRPLHGDTFSVSCVRYRDGTGSATYEMDLKTGVVK